MVVRGVWQDGERCVVVDGDGVVWLWMVMVWCGGEGMWL